MNKRSVLKYTAIPVLAALLLLLRALPGLTGKPLFRSPAYNAAERYLSEHYAEMDLFIGEILWSDHCGDYHASIYSPTDEDIRFTLVIGSLSKEVEQDTYAEDVLGGKTTADRLSREYGDLVSAALNSPSSPFANAKVTGLLELHSVPFSPEESYDVRELGKDAGFVKLSMETGKADAEEAARIVLELKRVMDAQDIPFSFLSLYLWGSGDVTVQGLPCREIFEEGMAERIQSYMQP